MKYERESTRDEWIPREVKRARARIHKESHGALYFVSRVLQCRATAYTLEAGTRLSQLGHPVWVGARLPAEHLHRERERERERERDTHARIHTQSHTHTRARTHTHTRTHTHSHTQSHTPLVFAQCCTSRLGRACLRTQRNKHGVFVCVRRNKSTDTHTDTLTHRHTDTQTHTHTHTHTDTHTVCARVHGVEHIEVRGALVDDAEPDSFSKIVPVHPAVLTAVRPCHTHTRTHSPGRSTMVRSPCAS